ncbi:BlaI/MecI/CopY family transcriptional regulator [Jonesia quinghaiensis]|uniref:BlaI/MecI/CopY family transcriptional regulator n=1 Tax=Jonesia quinghaiensis TaxID=262806 RepID=UPI00042650A7|nr:BlaI/MecI/CopY family transcriptional regulator [Jonesia quinghaiensis]
MNPQKNRAPGELEAAVMSILWDNDEPLSAKDITAQLPGTPPAPTTILTVLDRLTTKGDVVRTGSPRRARFTAATSIENHASTLMTTTLRNTPNPHSTLLHFAQQLNDEDLTILRKALNAEPTSD